MQKFPVFPQKGGMDYLRTDGERFYPNFSGELMSVFSFVYGPQPDAIRKALLELRIRHNWPRSYLAAVLGAPKATVRKWELGERKPSGAARKLIWLLHALLLRPDLIRNHFDIASWAVESLRADLVAAQMVAFLKEEAAEAAKPPDQAPGFTSEGV